MTDQEILQRIGSKGFPLRPSSLPSLMTCQRLWMDERKMEFEQIAKIKKAADTGSAVHKAIQAWHNLGDHQAALQVMEANIASYPDADLNDARLSFRPYYEDERNKIFAPNIITETEVSLQTKEGVWIAGTLDQLRKDNGDKKWYLFDVKTGKEEGWKYLHVHSYQFAAYVLAARHSLGLDVVPGGLICTYGYRRRNSTESNGVFQEYQRRLTLQKCQDLVDQVVKKFLELRQAAKPETLQGGHCLFCDRKFFQCLEGE